VWSFTLDFTLCQCTDGYNGDDCSVGCTNTCDESTCPIGICSDPFPTGACALTRNQVTSVNGNIITNYQLKTLPGTRYGHSGTVVGTKLFWGGGASTSINNYNNVISSNNAGTYTTVTDSVFRVRFASTVMFDANTVIRSGNYDSFIFYFLLFLFYYKFV
jgi:hypothetical protein